MRPVQAAAAASIAVPLVASADPWALHPVDS